LDECSQIARRYKYKEEEEEEEEGEEEEVIWGNV
jgi:hypothetical protein